MLFQPFLDNFLAFLAHYNVFLSAIQCRVIATRISTLLFMLWWNVLYRSSADIRTLMSSSSTVIDVIIALCRFLLVGRKRDSTVDTVHLPLNFVNSCHRDHHYRRGYRCHQHHHQDHYRPIKCFALYWLMDDCVSWSEINFILKMFVPYVIFWHFLLHV